MVNIIKVKTEPDDSIHNAWLTSSSLNGAHVILVKSEFDRDTGTFLAKI